MQGKICPMRPQVAISRLDTDMNTKMYWSPSTLSFYPAGLRATYDRCQAWPDDAREVSDEIFRVFSGVPPQSGQKRGCGPDGMPIWEDAQQSIPDAQNKRRKAGLALANARQQVIDRYVLMGQTVPPDWVRYISAISRIASGAECAQSLPEPPSDQNADAS